MINTFEKYSAVMSEMSPGGGGGIHFLMYACHIWMKVHQWKLYYVWANSRSSVGFVSESPSPFSLRKKTFLLMF